MNKIVTTYNGGFPLELDDYRFAEAGIFEAFKGLASFLGDDVILTGASLTLVSGTTYNYTAGYVVLNGEICKVDASASPIDISTHSFLYIEEDFSFDIDGLEDFENNVQYNTYQVRKAKIVGYTTAQSGKVSYIGTSTAEALINAMLPNYIHNFTKRQSWAQASDVTIGSGQNYINLNNSEGNLVRVNISSVNTTIERFNAPLPNGTWIAAHFIGTGQVKIKTGVSVTNPFGTPGDKVFVFLPGETALFVVGSGTYHLVNGFRLDEPVYTIGAGSPAPAFVSGWTSTNTRYKKDEFGRVTLMGQVGNNTYTTGTNNLIFTLPAGYRPTQNLSFDCWERISGGYAVVNINTDGEVTFYVEAYSSAPVNCSFDGISFLT